MIHEILAEYGILKPVQTTHLGNAGGFSGASIIRVEQPTTTWCLRQWPKSHPSEQTLDWIHRNLLHAALNGCPVPAPQRTRNGATFLKSTGHLWEISPWMTGQADFTTSPNETRLLNAVQKLAEFHQSTAQIQLEFNHSPNLMARAKQLANFPSVLTAVKQPALNNTAPWIKSLYHRLCERASLVQPCLNEISQLANQPMVLQPVIRDIWHDHILFNGNEVSGLIDFGAMQLDNIALDLSRMLGSLLGEPDNQQWPKAIEHYCSIRPLQENEIRAIRVLDRGGTLLGCLNWLRWILLEQRTYEDWQAVQRRIQILTQRLEQLPNV